MYPLEASTHFCFSQERYHSKAKSKYISTQFFLASSFAVEVALSCAEWQGLGSKCTLVANFASMCLTLPVSNSSCKHMNSFEIEFCYCSCVCLYRLVRVWWCWVRGFVCTWSLAGHTSHTLQVTWCTERSKLHISGHQTFH
jgi:hypothetical protein